MFILKQLQFCTAETCSDCGQWERRLLPWAHEFDGLSDAKTLHMLDGPTVPNMTRCKFVNLDCVGGPSDFKGKPGCPWLLPRAASVVGLSCKSHVLSIVIRSLKSGGQPQNMSLSFFLLLKSPPLIVHYFFKAIIDLRVEKGNQFYKVAQC